MKENTCCFFGHRKSEDTPKLKTELYSTVETLISENKIDTFLFGSKSKFNSLCHEVVSELKEKYPHIKRTYVRAEYRFINDDYKNYLLQSYEDTYYPAELTTAGRAAYVERNFEMIDESDVCVVYYNPDYMPPLRKSSRKNLTAYQPKSGTKIAYDYAKKKGKTIINLNGSV